MKSKAFDFNTREYDKLSISQLKRQADYWLRQYLLNDKTRNPQFCPLKKRHFPISQMQVAHFFDRGIMRLRYDLINCHLISKVSNEYEAQIQVKGYKSLHHKEYEEFITSEYGLEVVDNLRERSQIIKIFQREDYIKAIEKFRGNE